MTDPTCRADLSVIVPVGGRHAVANVLFEDYKAALDALGQAYELIFVLDGPQDDFEAGLRELLDAGEQFTVVRLTRRFGEATALMAGLEHSSGEIVVTLPAYQQVEGADLAKLLGALPSSDIAVGRRWPREGNAFERLRRNAFHKLLSTVTRTAFHDLGCGARAMHRTVLEELQIYGEQNRFLPVLASRQGFRVREVDLRQSPLDQRERPYAVREYARGILDIVTIFFLSRFTKTPLRFFGLIGAATFAAGAVWIAWLIFERVAFSEGLADRPALLLSSLLMMLGLQIFALGLLGELIIFTHANHIKSYQVESVIQFGHRKERTSA